jgi:glycosyltransferase involved in cell wall biosynthesis
MLRQKQKVVFIGTYPPRECGIATFTQDLVRACKKQSGKKIIPLVAASDVSHLDTHVYPKEVKWRIAQNKRSDWLDFTQDVNSDKNIVGVIVQHEYGIYGGRHGEHILSFLESCRKPVVVTLHTVLPDPPPHMRQVTKRIVVAADSLIVLTTHARTLLESLYPAAIGKVYVIPHGVHQVPFVTPSKMQRKLGLQKRIVLSTFGLLSRGKGIEYVLRSLPAVAAKHPTLLYLIIGETHPVVRRQEGESYRRELSELVVELHLQKHVKFYDRYMSLDELLSFLQATDVYISSSINPDQAVSGTLSYAMGTGRAVVSTQFPQACELVNASTGRLVPIKNSRAITQALQIILEERDALKEMHKAAYEVTRPMLWERVAQQYIELLTRIVLPPITITHLEKMTDTFGLFQFAQSSEPDPRFGYTLDDNARALIVCSWIVRLRYHHPALTSLTEIYFQFIERCFERDGKVINYLASETKTPTSQNEQEDLEESRARGLWALAEIMGNRHLSSAFRQRAKELFSRSFPYSFTHLRPHALYIKACIRASRVLIRIRKQLRNEVEKSTAYMITKLETVGTGSWYWFEDTLSNNNGVLSESLWLAGSFLQNQTYVDMAERSLQFLIKKTFMTNQYLPIGQSQWYRKGHVRSMYDQQPEDPTSMILALTTAYKLSGRIRYQNLAHKCFSWFLGNNTQGIALYDPTTGACFDGLTPSGVNKNCGAESLVSYLLARLALQG